MKVFILFSVCLVLAVGEQQRNGTESTIWALLVAGSNGWFNYRHQADICHAYQILHKHGVPDDHIVVMMYDDIAQNQENPRPGIIINHPNGKDVYHGVPKDYTGEDVTPENFLKILQGDEKGMNGIGSNKVIKSGPNDHVFVNFADHGGTGLLCFPNSELSVNELKNALTSMHEQNKYGQMVLYVEACESGSMFADWLPNDINIYATTAAKPHENSDACYWDNTLQTYLGDVYSVNWMENSDKSDLHKQSLIKQFKLVKSETKTSHVQEYGDLNVGKDPVADFQGGRLADTIYYPEKVTSSPPVSSRDVPLDILYRKYAASTDLEEAQQIWHEIQEMQQNRRFVETIYTNLVEKLTNGGLFQKILLLKIKPKAITQHECHEIIVHSFSKHCFNFGQNPYALKYAYVLVNICEAGFTADHVIVLMEEVCKNVHQVPGGIH